MPLSAGDLAWVRAKVGSTQPPTDADLNTLFDEMGTRERVALAVIEGRLADLLTAGPAKWALEGHMSVDDTAAIEGLAALRLELVELTGGESSPIPWFGGQRWSDWDQGDPDLVRPYFVETTPGFARWDPRSGG